MTDFTIPDELAAQLEDIAERKNRPMGELIERALRDFAAAENLTQEESPETHNAFLLIAQAADELGEGSKEGDIAERSREILSNDMPEYFMRRMHGDHSDTED